MLRTMQIHDTTHVHVGSDEPGADSLLFIGNATVLLRYAGFAILTDPNFVHSGEDVPLGYGLSTRRLTDPAIEIEQLPPLDFVLLSHFMRTISIAWRSSA